MRGSFMLASYCRAVASKLSRPTRFVTVSNNYILKKNKAGVGATPRQFKIAGRCPGIGFAELLKPWET